MADRIENYGNIYCSSYNKKSITLRKRQKVLGVDEETRTTFQKMANEKVKITKKSTIEYLDGSSKEHTISFTKCISSIEGLESTFGFYSIE
jgi:hypothetical protein